MRRALPSTGAMAGPPPDVGDTGAPGSGSAFVSIRCTPTSEFSGDALPLELPRASCYHRAVDFVFRTFSVPTDAGTALVAFTTRRGGVSPAPFDTNNLSHYVGDAESNVRENRARTTRGIFGSWASDFVSVNQVHGTTVAVVEEVFREEGDSEAARLTGGIVPRHRSDIAADAIVTARAQVPVGVLVADCVPVILVHEAGVVAAVHAGWRGIVAGVLHEAVRAIARLSSSPSRRENALLGFEKGEKKAPRAFAAEDAGIDAALARSLTAFIGPAIKGCCYEVDHARAALLAQAAGVPDVLDGGVRSGGPVDIGRIAPNVNEGSTSHLSKHNPPRRSDAKKCFRVVADRVCVDLQCIARMQLTSIGIPAHQIVTVEVCTKCRADLFFSYRRAVMAADDAPSYTPMHPRGTTGRQAGLVGIVQQ